MSSRQVIASSEGPNAIGPYSQAIRANGFIFVSGQVAIDPATNALIPDADIRAQTERVLKNIQGILHGAGSSMHDVVKTTVYLADLGEFVAMNEVYQTFFGAEPPARSTVEVRRLPRDVKIEIDVIAIG
ncbi:MAG TPA: RidA family protein [Terriglobales bacterium]|nr:RidA family protein [Terriglobales bacterium]